MNRHIMHSNLQDLQVLTSTMQTGQVIFSIKVKFIKEGPIKSHEKRTKHRIPNRGSKGFSLPLCSPLQLFSA